jgi:hypothetical protein
MKIIQISRAPAVSRHFFEFATPRNHQVIRQVRDTAAVNNHRLLSGKRKK